ncbi:MAG TPA: hypothetical protein VKX46_10325 [Ktedonobacteraceae bacterium]|nr:hypothetical protein [Ktedonobacteraceae bacterium]
MWLTIIAVAIAAIIIIIIAISSARTSARRRRARNYRRTQPYTGRGAPYPQRQAQATMEMPPMPGPGQFTARPRPNTTGSYPAVNAQQAPTQPIHPIHLTQPAQAAQNNTTNAWGYTGAWGTPQTQQWGTPAQAWHPQPDLDDDDEDDDEISDIIDVLDNPQPATRPPRHTRTFPQPEDGPAPAANPLPFHVKTVRAPRPDDEPRVPATDIEGVGYTISLPASIPLPNNLSRCKVCGLSIHESFSKTGWARCMQTNKLVHGHCYSVSSEGRSATWCAVCARDCASGQPMRIEGIIE